MTTAQCRIKDIITQITNTLAKKPNLPFISIFLLSSKAFNKIQYSPNNNQAEHGTKEKVAHILLESLYIPDTIRSVVPNKANNRTSKMRKMMPFQVLRSEIYQLTPNQALSIAPKNASSTLKRSMLTSPTLNH